MPSIERISPDAVLVVAVKVVVENKEEEQGKHREEGWGEAGRSRSSSGRRRIGWLYMAAVVLGGALPCAPHAVEVAVVHSSEHNQHWGTAVPGAVAVASCACVICSMYC
jgi:hypothetical protein